MPTCYDITGSRLELNDSNHIGKGGEGTVYVHPKDDNWAIKIYRPEKLDAQRREKIDAICQAQFHAKVDDVLFPILPVYSTRRRKTADIIGFTMQRAKGPYGTLYALMHPQERQRSFSAFTLKDNILVARRILRIVHRLHQQKIVIGDINARGFLIRQMAGDGQKMGHVLLIDADSFQVPANGKVYYCTVGVGDYTPPELQSRKLSRGILRSPESDLFGMAVLLFQLMHDGLHPFSGYHQGNMIKFEEAIRRKLYAHDPNNGMRPTRSRIIPAHYPKAIQDAFLRAFSGKPSERPTPREWNRLLSSLKLKDCGNGHHYPPGASHCPWCGKNRSAGRPHGSAGSSTNTRTTSTGSRSGATSPKRSYNYSTQSGNNIPWGVIIMVLVSLYVIYKGISTVAGWLIGSHAPTHSTTEVAASPPPVRTPRVVTRQKCLALAKKANSITERSQQYDCGNRSDLGNRVYVICQEQGHKRARFLLKQEEVDVASCVNRKERETRIRQEKQRLRQAACNKTVKSVRRVADLMQSIGCGPSQTYDWDGMYRSCLQNTTPGKRLLKGLKDTLARCITERNDQQEKQRLRQAACNKTVKSVRRVADLMQSIGCGPSQTYDWDGMYRSCLQNTTPGKRLLKRLKNTLARCITERNNRHRTYAAPSPPTSNARRGVDTWDDYRNGSQRGYGNGYGYDDSRSRPPLPKPRYIARWLRRDGHRATAWSATNRRGCLLQSTCNCPGKANNCGFYRPGTTALFWPNGCRRAAVIAICQVHRAR